MTDVTEDDVPVRLAKRWQVLIGAALAAFAGLWLAVTRADDLMRKADRVPAIEEAVLQLKVNEELDRARLERMEERQDLSDRKQDAANAMILQRLDQLLEERHVR